MVLSITVPSIVTEEPSMVTALVVLISRALEVIVKVPEEDTSLVSTNTDPNNLPA